ncbi:hypothetical protein CASFOL_024225 [Castilleja foliolosa]|uniref:Glycosyl hydrolase family 63 C-terminal domain-containing protein n=1 Tax=Castilleja foliolosa TaxID=1961234 RepID=A0ABD3CQQ8_9LAMI
MAGLYTKSYFVNPTKETVKPKVVTPLPAPKLMDLPMFQGEHKESLYWGTYRPHVYFGVCARRLNKEMAEIVRLFFYEADEAGNALGLGRGTSDSPDDNLLVFGLRDDVGSWQLHLESEFHYAGFKTPHIHNLSDLVQANLGIQARKTGRLQLSDTSDDAPNILVFQISARIPFKADVAFVSKSSGSISRTKESIRSLIGDSLTSLLKQKLKQFDDEFQRHFKMSDEHSSEACITVAKAALGNMLGGIGYNYGQSKISLPPSSNYIPTFS